MAPAPGHCADPTLALGLRWRLDEEDRRHVQTWRQPSINYAPHATHLYFQFIRDGLKHDIGMVIAE